MINKKVKNLEDLKAKPANIRTVNEEITGALDPAALLHAAEALEKQVDAYPALNKRVLPFERPWRRGRRNRTYYNHRKSSHRPGIHICKDSPHKPEGF